MKTVIAKLAKFKLPDLPTIGIFAFALASTWALFNLFNNSAIHPTWLYWIPAALVEIVTAWLTKHIVEAVYQLTRSNAPKQDLRFYKIVAIVSTALVVPTFAASILANLYEFQGQVWLALLFPVAVLGCAIGAQIPRSVKRYKSAGDDKDKAKLRKVERELRESRAETKEVRAELWQDREAHGVELEQVRADLVQSHTLKRADKTIYAQLCAGLNGSAPTDAQGVNDLLNEYGYYSKSDSTARNWAKREQI